MTKQTDIKPGSLISIEVPAKYLSFWAMLLKRDIAYVDGFAAGLKVGLIAMAPTKSNNIDSSS